MSVWVFDLDGTLVSTNNDYVDPMCDFAKLMARTLDCRAPHLMEILGLFQGIDRERFKTMRASRDRFPGSMVEAYRELCRRYGVAVDLEVAAQCLEIGGRALSQNLYIGRSLMPGAQGVLEFLEKKDFPLYCVTAGDYVVQMWKYRGYPLLRPFFPSEDWFIVVEWDKTEALHGIRQKFSGSSVFMVGDSVGSDLWPAYNAGIKPIYVPAPSVWDHGELKEELPPGTLTCKNMNNLLAALREGQLS